MEFRVLGSLEVARDETGLPLGGPKQRTALALLICRVGELVSSDLLVEELWGESATTRSRRTLQTYISNLRAHLGDIVVGERGGYRLDIDPDQVDAVRFDEVVTETHPTVNETPGEAAARMSHALALWRGRPYADVGGPWMIEQEIRRLQELWLRATEDRVEANLALGRHLESLAELEVLTVEHPLSERLHGQFMVALYRAGRQAEALRIYERIRRRLGDELGVTPSPDLEELMNRVLQHDERLRTPPADLSPGFDSLRRARGYELRELVASTRTGVVYRGYQPSVGREVAVQIVDAQFVNEGDFIRRFEAEAREVGRLEHPHIVTIFDCWRDTHGGYLVMPWLAGGTLADNWTSEPWPVDRVIELVDQLGDALDYVHRHGVVHGAIAPHTVMFDEDANAYLAGFGMARWLEAGSRPGAMMAPEESPGNAATARTDVFALAALARMLLSGSASDADMLDDMEPIELEASMARTLRWATAPLPDERCPSVAELLRRLHGDEPATFAPETREVRNPYKGLEAFDEVDAPSFFGRDALVAELVQCVEAHPVVCVMGPSGIGKSSVVRAGLLPRLRRSRRRMWYVTDMYPGAHPFDELSTALRRVAVGDLPDFASRSASDLAAAISTVMPHDGRLLVFIDQFEELFTNTADESVRNAFFDLIAELGSGLFEISLLLSLRADYVERAMQHAGLGELVAAAPVMVPAPDAQAIEEMIRGPAELVGVRFETGLVEQITAQVVDQPGGLPLLQYALARAFEHRTGPTLTADVYEAVGGVDRALDRTAEATFAELDPSARHAVRQLFLRLVAVDDLGHVARRRLSRGEIESLPIERAALDAVVDAFGRSRLLTFDRNPLTRSPTVEVAHESLISAWSRLRRWIDGHREDLVLTRRLAEAVSQWEEVERDPGYLLAGGRLEQFEALAASGDVVLSSAELRYLTESRRHEDTETRIRRRRRLGVVLGFAAAATLAVVLGLLAVFRAIDAQQARDLARSRELAASAVNILDDDPELSILLALEATAVADPPLEARVALRQAIASHRTLRTYARPPDLESRFERASADLDADGRLLAISAGGHLEVWDVVADNLKWEMDLPGDLVDRYGLQLTDPIFSSDSTRLEAVARWVSPPEGDADRPDDLIEGLLVVDVDSGDLVESFAHPDCPITGIVPGGPHLADTEVLVVEAMAPSREDPGGCDDSITEFAMWEPRTGTYRPIVTTRNQDLRGRSASADGLRLAFTSAATVVVDTESGAELLSVPTEESELALLSPDGRFLLAESAQQPRHLEVWDVDGGQRLDNLYHDAALTAEFSRDGSVVVTGGGDGTARVWDSNTGELLQSLRGHTSFVAEVEIDAGGNRLATVSADRTIRLWTLEPVGEIGAFELPFGQRRADGIDARSDHGIAHISTSEESGFTFPFDLTGRVVTDVPATAGQNARLTPDGTRYAAQRALGPRTFGSVWIHDAATGEPLIEMKGMCEYTDEPGPGCREPGSGPFADRVWDFAFSPDGRTLAMGGLLTRSFSVWEVDSGEMVFNSGPLWEADTAPTGPVSLAFDPDGSRLVVAGRNSLRDFDTNEWTMTEDIQLERRLSYLGLSFSPDGSILIGKANDGTFTIYDSETWELRTTVTAHDGLMRDLEISGDGELVATAGQDGFVRVWRTATAELLDVIPMPGGVPAQNVEFIDDDRHLLVSGNTGPVMVETLDFDELVSIAQARLTRPLTAEECQTYLRDNCEEAG